MNIQGAIKACSKRKTLFARPRSWKGSGEAIDLGRHCDSDRIRRVEAMSSGGLLTHHWNILPTELLCLWDLIPLTDLTKEVQNLDT